MKYVIYCRRKQILIEVLLEWLTVKYLVVDSGRIQETTHVKVVQNYFFFVWSFKCINILPYTGHSQYYRNNICCAHINPDKISFALIKLTLLTYFGRAGLSSGKLFVKRESSIIWLHSIHICTKRSKYAEKYKLLLLLLLLLLLKFWKVCPTVFELYRRKLRHCNSTISKFLPDTQTSWIFSK
jgi:hypothetical protein